MYRSALFKPANSNVFPESTTPEKSRPPLATKTSRLRSFKIHDEEDDGDSGYHDSSETASWSTWDVENNIKSEASSNFRDSGCHSSSGTVRSMVARHIDCPYTNWDSWSDDILPLSAGFYDDPGSWFPSDLITDQSTARILPTMAKTDVQTIQEMPTKDSGQFRSHVQLDNTCTSQELPSAVLENKHDQRRHSMSRIERVHDSGSDGIMKRVDEAKRTPFVSVSPVTQVRTTTVGSSPATTSLPMTPRDTLVKSSAELILEIWQIMQDEYSEYDACTPTQADPVTGENTDDTDSPPFMGPTSDADDSPKGSTSSSSSPLGAASKTSVSTSAGGFQRDEPDDEPPRKKQNRDREPTIQDARQPSPLVNQIPCPFLELDGCQGTNPTISELMRSLANRHRKVICKDCCTLLSVPEGEKKPLNMLQKHASEWCEPRCIGTSCSTEPADNVLYHRRTEKCPTWQTLTKEDRWKFIWAVINPESDPPVPNFQQGPGFEHSSQRRPCKQQPRARVNEICADLWRDIEAKEKRISTLEHELSHSNEKNTRMRQNHNSKVGNLENIIETLLDSLSENAIDVPGALRKRLRQECPTIVDDHPAIFGPAATKMDPTSHASQSLMSLPPGFSAPFSTPLGPPGFYNAHSQQLVGFGDGYCNPQMTMETNMGYQTGVNSTAWSPPEFHRMPNNMAWGLQPQTQNVFEDASLANES